jgi:hypothetical protein
MKNIFAVLLIFGAHESFACKNTSQVRVRFYGCDVGPSAHVLLGLNVDPTLPKVGDGIYEGPVGTLIDDSYEITVATQTPTCCTQPLKPEMKPGCVLEYVVYCDDRTKPWGIVVSSNDTEIGFEFAAHHRNDFGTLACPSRAQINTSAKTVVDLGLRDVVDVNVTRNGSTLVTFPVALADLRNGVLPKSKKDLRADLEKAAQKARSSGQSRDYIDWASQNLPNSGVKVVKR